jgi:hypothetical protein
VSYPTPELLREMASTAPDEEQRAICLAAADGLEQRGFYATAHLFIITESKALEMELKGITGAAEDQVPGWRVFFEGKVHVNGDGTDLVPVMAMESTENSYVTHRAAVIDAAHAWTKRPLSAEDVAKTKAQLPASVRLTRRQEKELALTGGVTLTKEQKRQMQRTRPVYILPSYVGVATDRYGNVIGAA